MTARFRALPHGSSCWGTPFGEKITTADGYRHYTAQGDETESFAARIGQVWPCSALRGKCVSADFSPSGDLLDLEGADPSAAELSAWVEAIDGYSKRHHYEC